MKVLSLLLGVVLLSGAYIAFLYVQKTPDNEGKQMQEHAATEKDKEKEKEKDKEKEDEKEHKETSDEKDTAPEEPSQVSDDEKQDEKNVDARPADEKKRQVVAVDGKVEIRIKKKSIKGLLDEKVISRIIQRHHGELRHCYVSKRTTERTAAKEQVEVKFTISNTGAVTSAGVTSGTLNDKGLESCIQRAFKRWRFPGFESGILVADYTLEFSVTPNK